MANTKKAPVKRTVLEGEEPAARATPGVPTDSAPSSSDLPSGEQLVRSTVIAAAVAAVLLVVAVLPAEYGVDPTGIGRLLGLTPMGELKVQLAREAAGHSSPGQLPAPSAPPRAPNLASHRQTLPMPLRERAQLPRSTRSDPTSPR